MFIEDWTNQHCGVNALMRSSERLLIIQFTRTTGSLGVLGSFCGVIRRTFMIQLIRTSIQWSFASSYLRLPDFFSCMLPACILRVLTNRFSRALIHHQILSNLDCYNFVSRPRVPSSTGGLSSESPTFDEPTGRDATTLLRLHCRILICPEPETL